MIKDYYRNRSLASFSKTKLCSANPYVYIWDISSEKKSFLYESERIKYQSLD
jgi:hypothetical protein